MAEKFSKWADKAGVNPFFPSRARIPSSFLSKCMFYVTAAAVAAPRLLVTAALAVAHALILSLLSVRSVMSVIMLLGMSAYRGGGSGGLFGAGADNGAFLGGTALALVVLAMLRTRIKQLGIKVATLVLGVNFSFLAANPRRLGLAAGKGADAAAEAAKISPGDVVVCSLTNALEVVALESFLHNPIYVFPVRSGEDVSACVSANFVGALMRTLSSVMSLEVASNNPQTVKEIATDAKYANRCVVLFAEGVRSNGDGVLRFPPEIFSSLVGSNDVHVHVLGFQYPSPEKDFSVAHPVGSFAKRLFWVASRNPFSPLSVKAEYVLAHLLKPLPAAGSSPKQLEVFVSELRDIQANLLKKNKVDMGPDDYVSFCEYYIKLSAGNIKDASVVADKRKKH